MVKITTTILVDGKPVKEEHELDTNPCGLNMIVHQQNVKVDVPEFVEVSPQDTIRVMEEMSESQWKWISESATFKLLWKSAFGDYIGRTYTYEKDNEVPEIPEYVFVLNMADYGLRHIAGMIVLGCEACQAGRSVFFRNLETYLHPKVERTITYMLRDMLSLFNRSGQVQVAHADGSVEDVEVINELPDKDDDKIEVVEVIQEGKDATNDVQQCIEWLELLQEHYSSEKAIAELNGERLSVAQMLDHVARNTQIGQWFVEQYVKKRDS